MQAFKGFLVRELVFTFLIATIALILFKSFLAGYYLPVFWVLLAVIALLTGIFHYSILQIQEKQTSKFANRFMMVSGIKMIIYLIFITLYAFTNPLKAAPFLISFFSLYLLFTIFEVFHIVRYLKKNRKV